MNRFMCVFGWFVAVMYVAGALGVGNFVLWYTPEEIQCQEIQINPPR